ncbi:MAG TPA: ATP-binding protein [Prolixibacteraceae bacterium]|nr:ATP-binding protein [Prolixibacteraceae bacterium]
MWIERLHTERLIEAVNTRPSVLLTGVRQVGKSSLLQRVFTDAEYVTLDKVIFAREANENPSNFLNRFKGRVIIDEVQYAPSLFRELKIKIDENRKMNGKWILTGSQQFNLMKSASESLAGRIRIITMGSLSASELNPILPFDNKNEQLWKGGFPEIWSEKLHGSDYFESYVQTYLERDLKQLLNVSNLWDFRRFMSLLAIRTGHLLNYSELAKDLGISPNTVKSWVNVLEISGIILLVPPYYQNLGKRLIKSPKVYFCDNGLIASLLNIDSTDTFEKSTYRGNLWENFLLSEWIKYGLIPGKNIFYYRDQNGVEIDFILENKGKTYLVEAKYNENPNPQKLHFKKVAPLFTYPVQPVVACRVEEKGLFQLSGYAVYNPLFGFDFSEL